MKVRIQSIHFDADRLLLDFVQQKVDKLVHFYDHIVRGEVFLKLDNSSSHENKVVQIKLEIPGHDLITSHQCKSFEEATDLCVAALTKQIKKHKEKQQGL